MKRKPLVTWFPFRFALLIAPLMAAWPQRAQAQTNLWWDNVGGTANDWGSLSNWSTVVGGGTTPAAFAPTTDVMNFNASSLTAAQTISLGAADRTVLGIIMSNATNAVTIQGTGTANRTLNIGANGISKTGTGAITIGNTAANTNANVRLSADQTWTNSNNTGAITIQNTVAASSAVARKLTLGGTSTAANIINGVISDNGTGVFSLDKTGTGLWVLAGANTFTGNTTVNDGTLQIRNSSALGAGTGNILVTNSGAPGTADNNNLQLSGGISVNRNLVLENLGNTNARVSLESVNSANGNANTWAGNITFKGGSNQALSANNAPLNITGNLLQDASPSTGIFLRGGNTGTITGTMSLGTASILKTDGGTWNISSTGNTHGNVAVANGALILNVNSALQANSNLTFGEGTGNNGRLDLNGVTQTLARLNTNASSTGTNHILRNPNLTTASTLTFATPAATTDTLTNVQVQGTSTQLGTLNLVSNGLGRTEFNGGLVAANSWTVNSGTLAFTGTNNRVLPGSVTGLAAGTIEKAGASTLAATGTWNNAGITNITGGTLALGAGTAGAVNVSDGTTLGTGIGGGVLNSSAITFGTVGATTYAPLLTTTGAVAPLNAASLTTAGTTVSITPQAASFTVGTYRLLDYTGAIGGNGFAGFALGATGTYPHMTAGLANPAGQVNLVVSAVDSLIWAGQSNGVWDVNTTSNFALASSPTTVATFYQGDAILFGDTADVPAAATAITNRTITGSAVTIGNLNFTNSTGDYSIANLLTGPGSISKSGTSAVTLSGANLLSGGAVTVTGGTLKIGNSDALRGAGLITVSGGGTFDANGTAVGVRYPELLVSGAGVGGNGAIVNNGADITNNSHFAKITLAGDTTWGGSGRYDLVAGQIFNGGAFTLTKTGAGQLWYNPSAGSVLENVIVNGGVFGSQQRNPLSATATVTVNNGGQHQIFSAVAQQHKVVLNDGGILSQGNAAAGTINGEVTLNGTTVGRNIQAVTGGTMIIAGKLTGTGGFTVNGAGTVQLRNAANDYAGDTALTLGTLNFDATGILPATTNVIFSGGTLDPVNRTHSVASISGLSGSINQGTAGTGNVLTTQSTTTTFNGTVNRANVTMGGSGSLTLGGTADNSAGSAILNSGTLIFAKGNITPVTQAVHAVGGGAGVTVNGGTLQLGGTYDNTTPGTGVNAPPAGINPTTYVDQIYNGVGVVLNAGTFDLNGRQEAINTLTNPAGAGGTVTNTAAATVAKLFIGSNNGTSIFGGGINDGTGTVAVEKIGAGTLTLTGTSNFSGGLTATAGTVVLDGTLTGSGSITVNGTSVFAGSGTSGGPLTAATGTTLRVGTASGGTAATTLTLGGLTLTGGTNLNLDFNSAGTTLDKIATTVTNGLSISGANPLNVVLSGAGWVTGTYPILTYAGAVQGTGATNATLALSTPVGHSTVNVVDDTLGNVNLVVAGAANKWVGNVNSTWDTNSTLNWNAVDNLFLTGDSVVFDNTATSFTPNILANQTAAGVTFDNTTPYTLSSTGAFGIAGTSGLIKKNTGTVTLTSANTYTGTTDVQQGTLIANYNTGTAQTVLAAASTINVASGATFKAVANDANLTLANNLTGSGTVVIDPHLTAGAAVRDGNVTGNNAGFTGTLRLSPTVIGDGSGTFRTTTPMTVANTGGATIDVDAGGQVWLAAATFTNNLTISGHGYAETAGGTPVAASGLTPYTGAVKGGLGAIRMSAGTIISGNVTLDGSARIGTAGTTGTISGSIGITNPSDILSVGGGNLANTLILTGTNNVAANALKQVFVNAGGTAGTNILAIGANGTTGTLGTGSVTLNGDGAIGAIRFDRADGYTLAAGNTITSSGTTPANTRLFIDTQGTGFIQNGVDINLGGGALQFGTQAARTGSTGSFNGNVTVGAINLGTASTGAVMNILPGANIVNSGNFNLGEANNMSAAVNQTGGDVTVGAHVRVGHFQTNTSAYNLSAGTLTVANINTVTDPSGVTNTEQNGGIYLGVDGTGTMTQSGGTVTTDWIVLDNRGDTAAGTNMPDGIDRYTLTSGTLNLRSQWGITQRNASTAVTLGGGTIQNGGTNLQVRLDMAPDVTGPVTLDTVSAGNSFNLLRSATGAGSLALTGGGTLKLTTATTQSISVPLSGTGALEKLGTGITTLGSANTYNGPTTISAGTLQAGAVNAIPSGAGKGDIVFSAAGTNSVLDLNGFDTGINGLNQNTASSDNLVVNNATGTSKTLTLGNNDTTATFAGIIADNTSGTGTLALTKTGTGTQTLSGASTFTGPITVNGGRIAFPSSPATAGPLGNSTAINLNGAGLNYTGSTSSPLNRSVVIGAGHGTFEVASSTGTLTVGTLTSTGGNLIKTGPGTLTLSSTTTLNGGLASVTVSDGTLQAGFGTGGIAAVSVGATGILDLRNSAAEVLTLGAAPGALTVAGGASLGFELGATSDQLIVPAGGTAVTSGTVTLNFFNLAGFGAGTYNLLSAPGGLGGATYTLGSAPSGFNYTINPTASLVSLDVVAFVPRYWTGSQATTSWATLNAGPVGNFSTDAAGLTNSGAVPGAAHTAIFSATNAVPVAGAVTTTLDGNYTLDGLQFISAPTTPATTAVNINQGTVGDTLTLAASSTSGGILVGANGGAVTLNVAVAATTPQTWNIDGTGASSLTIGGANASVAFNAAVTKTGGGALTLNSANTGTGNFTLGGGTLNLGNNAALPSGTFTINAGTTLDATGGAVSNSSSNVQTWNGNFAFTGTNNLNLGTGAVTLGANVGINAAGSTLTVGGIIGDGGNNRSLTKTGAGVLVLNGANTFGGGVTLSQGTLNLGHNSALGSGPLTLAAGTVIDNTKGSLLTSTGNNAQNWNGSFTFTGTDSMDLGTGAVTLGAAATITTVANTLTAGGGIDDGAFSYGLTKAGAGTLALGGTSTYNGATVINEGTLRLTGSLTGGGAISTSGTAILSQTSTGVISGAATLTQSSSATSVLAGDNAHTGLTSVTAGGLTLSGNNSSASGGVLLNGGQLNINSNNALGTSRLTLSAGTFDNTDAVAHTQAGNPVQTWSNNASVAFTGTQALNLGTGAVSLGTNATAASFTLTNNSLLAGTSLTVGGDISAVAGGTAGVKTLTIAGPGNTALTGNLTRGSATALDVTVTSGGTTTLSGPASSIRTININGGASSIVDLGAGNLTITNGGTNGFRSSAGGTINASGGGKIVLGSDLLDNGTADGTTLTVNAGITGPFTFEIYGGSGTNTGVTVLTGQNTFTGRVDINGGNLSVSNIGNTGSLTSNLGSGTLIQSGAAVLSGSTVTTGKLIYTGAGETTNRVLSLNGAGFAIEQAAPSGNLLFSANVAVPNNAAKTLFLLGSTAGTGELGGVIPNNTAATSITKLGSGTWELSGANTYTGATTVKEGTLRLTGAKTGTSGVITVGDTAGLNATLEITNGTYTIGGTGTRFNVGNQATTAGTGTVNQSGGAIVFTTGGGDQLLVGQNTVGNTGVYNLSGGSVTTFTNAIRGVMLGVNSNLTPGAASGGGTFNLSGTGALNMTAASGGSGNAILQIGRSDTPGNNTTNAFNQTGGTADVGILAMGGATGGSTGVSSTLNLTGGTFSANSFTLLAAGDTNTAVINIGSTAQVTLPVFPTNAKGTGSTATLTLDSTTGFLSPLAASANYMPAGTFTNAYLTANGAKFNVGSGKDITMAQVLENAPAAAGTLTKSGVGTLTLTGTNLYSGATTISAGTLSVDGTGSINNSAVTVNGGTFRYNSSVDYTNTLTLASGTVGGTNLNGNLGGLTIGASQTLSPGNSPGTLVTTSQTWGAGGSYLWEINDATGTAGTNWDLANGSSTLTVSATSGSPFSIQVASLTVGNAPGAAANFNDATSYNWKLADFASAITLTPDQFVVNTAGFTNPFTGTFAVARGDSGAIGGDSTEVFLTYTAVPEPSTTVLGGLALLALRRRRRA